MHSHDLKSCVDSELSVHELQIFDALFLLNFPISDVKVELVLTSSAGGNLMGEKGGSFDPTIPYLQNLIKQFKDNFTKFLVSDEIVAAGPN